VQVLASVVVVVQELQVLVVVAWALRVRLVILNTLFYSICCCIHSTTER
jgi:hypothetical protein